MFNGNVSYIEMWRRCSPTVECNHSIEMNSFEIQRLKKFSYGKLTSMRSTRCLMPNANVSIAHHTFRIHGARLCTNPQPKPIYYTFLMNICLNKSKNRSKCLLLYYKMLFPFLDLRDKPLISR